MNQPHLLLLFPRIDLGRNYATTWLPYGVMYIAQALRQSHGAEVVIFDQNRHGEAEFEAILAAHLDKTFCVGLSLMTGGGQIANGLRLVERIKHLKPDMPVVAGGPHVNVLPRQTLEHPLIDATLKGFGQISMPAFLDYLLGRRVPGTIPGLLLKKGGTIIEGPDETYPVREDLDTLDWSIFNAREYIRPDALLGERTLSYLSTQGCLWSCRYCYEQIHKRRRFLIQPGRLLQDIRELASRHHLDGLKFYDADFFLDLDRAKQFADALASEGPSLKWAASVHPQDIIRALRRWPDFLATLRASGCVRLLMGVESGSDRILRQINKRVTVRQLEEVTKAIADHGIVGNYCFIVGFPGEEPAEIEQTFRLAERLRGHATCPEITFHVFAPYPGTPMFEDSVNQGFVSPADLTAWSEYDYYSRTTPWTDELLVKRVEAKTRRYGKRGRAFTQGARENCSDAARADSVTCHGSAQ